MGEKEASGKPPHSFLPNLQPGRVSPAARREQVLAGPLTRASTPQSRSQVSGNPLNLPSESPESWDLGLMHRKSCCREDRHCCCGGREGLKTCCWVRQIVWSVVQISHVPLS